MKLNRTLFLSFAALAFGVRPAGFSTANAKADAETTEKPGIPPEVQQQLDEQAKQIAELREQLAKQNAVPAEEEPAGTLALLAKGAGVDLADVRWRVLGGLDPEQAVQAALAQKESDRRKAEKAAAKKKAEEAAAKKK